MITKRKYKDRVLAHAKIVESYREKGKTPRKRTLLNLGSVKSEEDLQRYNQILDCMRDGKIFVEFSDITAKSSKEYGVTYTTRALLDKYGVSEVLKEHLSMNKADFDVYGVIRALITNRLVEPSSDLAAHDWIMKHYPENLGVLEHHLYRALDHLIAHKDEIESELFAVLKKRLGLDTSKTFYDLTSSYVEGTKCTLAMYGYNRDGKKGKKQIVLGLAMCDGIPVMHEVYKGNTVDKETLQGIQESLRKRLGIMETTVVADRGLMTEENIQALEEAGFQYIIGVNRRHNKIAEDLLVRVRQSSLQQSAREEHTEVLVRDGRKFVRRYIVCQDKETRRARLNTLDKIRKKMTRRLTELQRNYQASLAPRKGRKMIKESLMRQAFKVLGKNKRLFTVAFEDGLTFSLNKENWNYERKIAGKYLLLTTTDLKPEEVMKAYKELQTVENAFDEIKNFVDLRPINHHKPQRVRAHAFVCVLSFLIECIIERSTSRTARKVIDELKTVKMINLETKRIQKRILTELSPQVKAICKELKVPEPMAVVK